MRNELASEKAVRLTNMILPSGLLHIVNQVIMHVGEQLTAGVGAEGAHGVGAEGAHHQCDVGAK